MPFEIGFSGSWKVQSGFNYGRTISVAMPVEGNRTIRVEPIDANRYPTVAILDFRLDKSFDLGKFGKVIADAGRVQHPELGRADRRCARPTPRPRRSTK